MEQGGSSSMGPRRGKFQRLSNIEGHVSKLIRANLDYPLFPGNRRFMRLLWLQQLTSNITLDMTNVLKRWGINNLAIHAKRYHEVHLDWAAMGAMVELWHPQTHTFLFKSFEATILLEEVEILLGLRRMKQGDEDEMAITLRCYTSKAVLESFMDAREAYKVRTEKGIHLQKLAIWTMKELSEAGDGEKLEQVMKGFAICVAGALLFPSIDSVLEPDQLSAVCAIWEGERLGLAVLAFLYSGLMVASLGRPPYGSMLLFTCWADLHLKFYLSNEVPTSSRIFSKSPLRHLDNIIGLEGRVANRVPQLKTSVDWRDYLQNLHEDVFNLIPMPFLNRDLRTRLAPGVDLRLIGASEFVLYNPHRCLPQLGLARCTFEGPSHIPLIKHCDLGTNNDGEEADTSKALWKVCIFRRPILSESEVESERANYVRGLKKLRS